jgi:dethiobiotin synthetase
VLAAAIVAALRRRGVPATALKPVLTGLDDPADTVWPRDHELLAEVSGQRPSEVALARYGPATSPHLAGELAGTELDVARLRRQIATRLKADHPVIVEGVGGLLVPLSLGYDVRALAADLALPVLVAARAGLGTINHTLLTLEAARAAMLNVVGVVLTPWPDRPDQIALSNRHTIERLGQVEVFCLGAVAAPHPDLLADAAKALPLDAWLASATVSACASGSSPG